ncbi:MAG: hypothetical protein IJ240_09430 [Clostridia bacterium]|nr:hypothetical protein [Clostridia bacterium]
MTYWMYTFVMREANGIDFHIDYLENVWIQRDGAQLFAYTEKDLALGGVGPDLPALQKLEFTGGMPINQPNMIGVGCRLTGHDANDEALTFTAYIPFPQY